MSTRAKIWNIKIELWQKEPLLIEFAKKIKPELQFEVNLCKSSYPKQKLSNRDKHLNTKIQQKLMSQCLLPFQNSWTVAADFADLKVKKILPRYYFIFHNKKSTLNCVN